MCGIAGILQTDGPVDPGTLRAMTDLLRHRGPDASGLFVDGGVGLGHRRLSIIDTSAAANQPLFNEGRSVAVVFNGEIYNFQALTADLEARGHRFATHSDTEAIVHAWEEHGEECLAHFRGMFALALYDARRRCVFLARDRLGKKPLFYTASPRRFAFASEIKALLALPDLDRELDVAAIGDYATYGNSAGERTIYRTIRKLLPGHCLRLDLGAGHLAPHIRSYWSVRIEPDPKPSEEEWLEEIDHVLSEAVRLRMISDVPLGAFLSGGVDSSLVVAYMARHSARPVKTFTIGFHEATHDESPHAAAVAAHLGTEHHVEHVTPGSLDVLPELVRAYDEPFADASAIPTFYLCGMTRAHVTVALSGDGGDESFLGYSRYPQALATDRASRRITRLGRAAAGLLARALRPGRRGKASLERLARRGFDLYHHTLGWRPDYLSLLRPEVRAALPPPDEGKLAADFARQGRPSLLECYQHTDLLNYLPDDILVKVDRASMAHSLEVRCPLLDQELVELAARIPASLKLKGFTGKTILRNLAARHVPRALLDRPKQGFAVPLAAWFKRDLADMLRETVADAESPVWAYLDRRTVHERIRGHLPPGVDSKAALWRVLFLHRWCDACL